MAEWHFWQASLPGGAGTGAIVLCEAGGFAAAVEGLAGCGLVDCWAASARGRLAAARSSAKKTDLFRGLRIESGTGVPHSKDTV